MSEHQLITPRRNFLIRALGFTAAGATMSIPIVTLDDAKSRIEHHKAGLSRAWKDYYAGAICSVQGNALQPDYVLSERKAGACLIFYASSSPGAETMGGII
jgi:hypothetical protein